MKRYCKVAVKYPGAEGILTYEESEEFSLKRGDLVEVPLGRRKANGCVLKVGLSPDDVKEDLAKWKLKPVSSKMSELFSLTEKELSLYEWMSKYYHYNLGMVIFECLPTILKRPRDVLIKRGKNIPFPHTMSPLQDGIYQDINEKRVSGFDRYFIHGVTGSGKTLVYLNLIKDTLAKGKSVLFLLPEINLTPQFTETFLEHLDCPVLPYHSGVNNSEKNTIWKFLKESNGPVLVMGVRSSVFLPIENLGLVVVDEEHDSSFKQSDRCPYNGRDVATKKAQLSNAPIVLGSATPALENYYQFKDLKKGHYYTMKERVAGSFPHVELIDSRSDGDFNKELWPFQPRSIELMKERLAMGEQVLVFANRLGFASYVQCRGCGHKFEDPNTNVALRYFKRRNVLSSSHSDYEIPMPEICPECGNMSLLQKGFGTEKIQEVLEGLFPERKIDRFDRDEIKTMTQLTDKLDDFHSGRIDILVGTQMLSKGHNFEKVNLVLVLGVDSMMNFPDFRAIERTYQTVTQIMGRAGRYSKDAKVVIQTLAPDNNVFKFLIDHSFDAFFEEELAIREFSGYPPFSKLCVIHFSSRFRDRLVDNISAVANHLKSFVEKNSIAVEVLGPTPATIEKRANQFTWCFVFKTNDINQLHFLVKYFEDNYKRVSGISFKVDIDPYQLLG